MLFYLLNKNHPFENGNKRVALTALLVLLYRNHRWILAGDAEMYGFSIYVASSDPAQKDKVILDIHNFINARMCTFKESEDYVQRGRDLNKWRPRKRRGKKWSGYPKRFNFHFGYVVIPEEAKNEEETQSIVEP